MESLDRRSLIAGLVGGLVLGLLLGALLFWVLFPVQWTDAHPYDLAPEAQAKYVGLVADSFALDRDPARSASYFELWTPEEKSEAFSGAIAMYNQQGLNAKAQAVEDLALVLSIPVTPDVSPAPTEPAPSGGILGRFQLPCMAFLVILLILVVAWLAVRFLLKRRAPREQAAAVPRRIPEAPQVEEWEGTGQPPLGHFISTYQLGEDTYDESFSIETPMGEFLGECGMGISETIGEGEPDKVTAFEVWLFDKSDIRTVTKVLMSEHAFTDDALRAKLASKGEAVLAQPGAPLVLETSGLQVRVDVTELAYGEGDAPPQSFFSKLSVELVALGKPGPGGASSF